MGKSKRKRRPRRNPAPLRQTTEVKARIDFSFRNPDSGRTIQVRKGQLFWVTNPPHAQTQHGVITIDRAGKGVIGHGYGFSFAEFDELFEIL